MATRNRTSDQQGIPPHQQLADLLSAIDAEEDQLRRLVSDIASITLQSPGATDH
ncbi:hypothetical protein ACWEO2_13260 [Nocardia sp. NPDC004278]